jgi:hypothetical protein
MNNKRNYNLNWPWNWASLKPGAKISSDITYHWYLYKVIENGFCSKFTKRNRELGVF